MSSFLSETASGASEAKQFLPLSRRSFLATTGLTAAAASLPALPATAVSVPAESSFVHPGILHRTEDLERMRQGIEAKEDPILRGFTAMAADARSSSSYTVQNTGQITTWGRGPSIFAGQAVSDAAAAYQNALMWALTGKRQHADKARDILNIWARSLQSVAGADGQLGSGLQGFKFANAAELLRHTGYNGWAEEDFAAFVRSLRSVWYDTVSGYALFANGNWDDAALQTILAIAVLSEDKVMFENGLRWAAHGPGNGSVLNRVVNASGQGQESGRDQPHEQLGQGLLGYSAQVAWNQGVGLFGLAGNRMLASYEYIARYNLGYDDVPFVPDLDRTGKYFKSEISARGRGQFRPIFELAYSHYVSRLGLPAPNTQAVIFRNPDGSRVIEGWHEDDPGWGTLTYARPAGGVGSPQSAPGIPGGVHAVGSSGQVALSWIPSVEPTSGAPARSYTIKRSTTPGGPQKLIAEDVRGAGFTDKAVSAGRTYFYVVAAVNEAGTSPDSLEAAAVPGLPEGWDSSDVATSSPGTTTFDGERFTVEDRGSDIGGQADSFRYTYTRLKGDGDITARIVHPISSQYAKAGVMMRSSLEPGSPHASLLIQGLPLHTWSGVWTTRPQAGSTTTGAGSTPVPASQRETITVKAGFPISAHGSLPQSATPIEAPYVEGAGDGYRLRRPYWVRLTRKGHNLTGFMSPDGRTWTEVGSTEINLGDEIYVGLASCSCLGSSESGTTTFDNVRAGTWSVHKPTRTAHDLTATPTASGVELAWTDPDPASLYTVKRGTLSGRANQTIATNIAPQNSGVVLSYRDTSVDAGKRYFYAVSKTNIAGEGPAAATVTANAPATLTPEELRRTALYGNTGTAFTHRLMVRPGSQDRITPNLPPGLRYDQQSGHISGVPRKTGTYQVPIGSAALNIHIGEALPEPWASADFGDYIGDEPNLHLEGVVALKAKGIASTADGKILVRGAGLSLNVNGQGMTGHVAYQRVEGNREVVARVAGQENAGSGTRIGVLMSKSLSPFDLMSAVVLSPSGSETVLRSVVAGRATTTTGGAAHWVRIRREGANFQTAVSEDGESWTVLGNQTLPNFGEAPYYAGLVVCSGDRATLTTGIFDQVSIR